MRSLRAAVGASAAALLLLAGCGDDPNPGDPSSTWTPTATPESPTSAATQAPVEPALPQAATKATEAGARAFIGYYWELINYAQVTGDVKALHAVSGPKCGGCIDGVRGIRKLYQAGGHAEGGRYTERIEKINPLRSEGAAFVGYEALVRIRNEEQTIVNGDGSKRTLASSTNEMAVAVLWVKKKWRLDVMELQ